MNPEINGTLIVTGANRGIGAACALAAGRAGYYVVIISRRNAADAAELAAGIKSAGGVAIALKADVTKSEEMFEALSRVDTDCPPITGLINNAGISGPRAGLLTLSDVAIEEVFQTNFFAAVRWTREAFGRMARDRGGRGGSIIMISSQAAQFGGVLMPAYAASKAALNAFTIGFAREAAPAGVRVNAVSPGVIDTQQHQDSSPERQAALLASIPMGRMGLPEEVANIALWLMSSEAAYVSGAIIPVHGAR